jgi:hypothetical protein
LVADFMRIKPRQRKAERRLISMRPTDAPTGPARQPPFLRPHVPMRQQGSPQYKGCTRSRIDEEPAGTAARDLSSNVTTRRTRAQDLFAEIQQARGRDPAPWDGPHSWGDPGAARRPGKLGRLGRLRKIRCLRKRRHLLGTGFLRSYDSRAKSAGNCGHRTLLTPSDTPCGTPNAAPRSTTASCGYRKGRPALSYGGPRQNARRSRTPPPHRRAFMRIKSRPNDISCFAYSTFSIFVDIIRKSRLKGISSGS